MSEHPPARYQMMLPEPVPSDAVALVDSEDRIVGFEWDIPGVREIPVRRRDPAEARARLLNGPLPPDLAQALADEITP